MNNPNPTQKKEKEILKLFFISSYGKYYDRFLYDNEFKKDQVIWVRRKEQLLGRVLHSEQIIYGKYWYEVCNKDFINSSILNK